MRQGGLKDAAQLCGGSTGGGMIEPAGWHGQASLRRWPPAIQINQQALLQRHDLLPFKVPLRIVVIGVHQLSGEFNPKVLQQVGEQRGPAAMHAHHKDQRRGLLQGKRKLRKNPPGADVLILEGGIWIDPRHPHGSG